jgi:hypothetical protein
MSIFFAGLIVAPWNARQRGIEAASHVFHIAGVDGGGM